MGTVETTAPEPVVKLQLSIANFDFARWEPCVTHCERSGIRFTSLAELGDNDANRRCLYELNKACSADIPGRGPFYTYEEYCRQRLDVDSFTAAGVIIALHDAVWVGMAAVSHHPGRDYGFNEMTGVVRAYRRRGIATALKVLSIRFAQSLGVPFVYTFHAAANEAAIRMNRRLGYTDR